MEAATRHAGGAKKRRLKERGAQAFHEYINHTPCWAIKGVSEMCEIEVFKIELGEQLLAKILRQI